jgi:hypothetical protein
MHTDQGYTNSIPIPSAAELKDHVQERLAQAQMDIVNKDSQIAALQNIRTAQRDLVLCTGPAGNNPNLPGCNITGTGQYGPSVLDSSLQSRVHVLAAWYEAPMVDENCNNQQYFSIQVIPSTPSPVLNFTAASTPAGKPLKIKIGILYQMVE